MKLSTQIYLMALSLALLLLNGCIGEDMSDCSTGLEVYFTYEPATYARLGVNEQEVDRIDIFAFDAQGVFRGVWTDINPTLSPAYFMNVTGLSAGEYRFIAWCGLHGDYKTSPAEFIVGRTTFGEALLILEHNGQAEDGVAPLFHAQKIETVQGTSGEQKIYLPLVQAYNTINLTTEGLQDNTDIYRMTIYDDNGKYHFDYSFAGGGEFNYTTTCGKDVAGQLSATLHILKLAADRSPVFEIRNQTQDTTLYREDLVMLINEIGTNPYDMIHTYDIHLKFGLDVSVSINGWWVVNDGEIGLN